MQGEGFALEPLLSEDRLFKAVPSSLDEARRLFVPIALSEFKERTRNQVPAYCCDCGNGDVGVVFVPCKHAMCESCWSGWFDREGVEGDMSTCLECKQYIDHFNHFTVD